MPTFTVFPNPYQTAFAEMLKAMGQALNLNIAFDAGTSREFLVYISQPDQHDYYASVIWPTDPGSLEQALFEVCNVLQKIQDNSEANE